MNNLIYPTLDLFLYDLRNGLGDNEKQIKEHRDNYKKKLPERFGDILFNFDDDFEVDYVDLLPNQTPESKKRGTVKFEAIAEPYPLEGYYYPVRMGDSYGLLIDCSVKNQTEAKPAECFANLKTEILQKLDGVSCTLGESWMISGWLPANDAKSPLEIIAKACYDTLMPDGNWEKDLQGKGQFLGGAIFELYRYRLVLKERMASTANIQSIQDNQHVIIIIYPDEAAARKAAEFYPDWMILFLYRHKILWAYGQSRLVKESIKNYFSRIQEAIKTQSTDDSKRPNYQELDRTLAEVQNLLKSYTVDLTQLDFQGSTIDINLSNYKKRIASIEKKAESKSDLKFLLEEFSAEITDKYQLQITKDRENLERGLKLLENTINAVSSRVAVQKAKGDRAFQEFISIWGVGWAIGSLVVQQQGNLQKVNPPKPPEVITILAPAIVAVTTAVLIWLLKRLFDRSYFLSKILDHLLGQIPGVPKKKD